MVTALLVAPTALAAVAWPDRGDDSRVSLSDWSTRTVPPKGPGEDYKSNPAESENVKLGPVVRVGDVPIETFSLVTHGADTLEAAVQALNPTSDPSIVVCEEEDGSFRGVNARWAIPPSKRPPDGVSCAVLSD
jgi:hypothetical protein